MLLILEDDVVVTLTCTDRTYNAVLQAPGISVWFGGDQCCFRNHFSLVSKRLSDISSKVSALTETVKGEPKSW